MFDLLRISLKYMKNSTKKDMLKKVVEFYF